jgi:hypothetical protein
MSTPSTAVLPSNDLNKPLASIAKASATGVPFTPGLW